MAGKKREAAWRLWTNTWFPELLAIAIAFLATLSIMILFAVYDGRQDFEWRGITLNATVSTLSTISRLTLLIAIASCIGQLRWNLFSQQQTPVSYMDSWDNASRGAWGCLILLWETKSLSVAAVGAWLTVLAIVFEPSVQQALRFRSDYRLLPSGDGQIAEIATATVWEGGRVENSKQVELGVDGTLSVHQAVDLDFSMQSALLSGLVAPQSQISQQTAFRCSSNHCQWEPYSSLAVCSACHDVRGDVAVVDVRPSDQLKTFNYYWTDFDALSANFTGDIFQLPNNLSIWNKKGFSEQALMMTTYTSRWSDTLRFKQNNTLIFALSVLRLPAVDQEEEADPFSQLTAAECGLYFCTKVFKSRVVNGTLVEETSELSSTMDPTSFQALDPTIVDDATEHPDTLYAQNTFDVRSNIRLLPGARGSVPNLSGAEVSQGGAAGLITNAKGLLYTDHFNTALPAKPHLTITLGGGMRQSKQWGNVFQPAALQMLYDSTDLESTFANLANSMTSDIRRNGAVRRTERGIAEVPVTLVRIRWPWTAYSCTLLIAGLFFLGLCMFLTTNAPVPLWKTSALAILFHQLRPRLPVEDSHNPSVLELQRLTEKLYAQLGVDHTLDVASGANENEQEKGMAARSSTTEHRPRGQAGPASNVQQFAFTRKPLPVVNGVSSLAPSLPAPGRAASFP